MKSSRGKRLSARVARDLLGRIPHRSDPEMSRALMCDVYVLQGGAAILLYEDGKGIYLYSYDDLVTRYQSNLKHAFERRDELSALLPEPERFLTDVTPLIAALPALMALDATRLDFSEESLGVVDSAIRRIGSERVLTAEVFPSLVAYVGEVLRREVNGSWEIETTHEGTRRELDIVDSTGTRYALLRIYKQLIEYGRTASMQAFVHAALTTHRFLPRH
jgi:hypothetical protein